MGNNQNSVVYYPLDKLLEIVIDEPPENKN